MKTESEGFPNSEDIFWSNFTCFFEWDDSQPERIKNDGAVGQQIRMSLVVTLVFILDAKEMIRRRFWRNQFLRALAEKKKKLVSTRNLRTLFISPRTRKLTARRWSVHLFFNLCLAPVTFPDRLFQNLITSEKSVWRANEAKLWARLDAILKRTLFRSRLANKRNKTSVRNPMFSPTFSCLIKHGKHLENRSFFTKIHVPHAPLSDGVNPRSLALFL